MIKSSIHHLNTNAYPSCSFTRESDFLTGHGKAFGTFGELLQGRLENHEDFLVTFPIARYSYAIFVSDPSSNSVTIRPAWKQKSQKLATMLLEHFALPSGGRLTIESELPVGKGLASSSADLVATARAIAACFNLKLTPAQLQGFLYKIEPTDGVMYTSVVSFYHRKVQLCESLGFLPPLTVFGLDEGGMLDTLQFNQLPRSFSQADEQEYVSLLKRISVAIREHDLPTIGQVATRSALLNQRLNPRRTLQDLLALCQEVNGLGIIVAHSGTCIGILLSPQDPRYCQQVETLSHRLSRLGGTPVLYYSLHFREHGKGR